jgi:hypothetical protein
VLAENAEIRPLVNYYQPPNGVHGIIVAADSSAADQLARQAYRSSRRYLWPGQISVLRFDPDISFPDAIPLTNAFQLSTQRLPFRSRPICSCREIRNCISIPGPGATPTI